MSLRRATSGRRPLALAALLALAFALLGLGGAALGYWSAGGSGTAHGAVATLGAPSITAATPGAGSVALSWSSVSAPDDGTVSYHVSRDGGAAGPACPGASSPSTQTSCTDTGVPVGAHEYTVTAVWRSWTATSAPRAARVAFGPATRLLLNASTTATTAGAGDALTITAQDAAGNTVTTYAGTKSLTFGGASSVGANRPTVADSSGTAVAFGTAESIAFSDGVASVSGSANGLMTLYAAETAGVTVSDGTIGNGAGLSIAVSPAATSTLALSTPATQTAGSAFDVSLTARDSYGNTTPAYTGSKAIAFSGPSESPGASKPSYPASVSFGEGTASATVTLYDAQTTTLSAKDGTLSASTGSFTVAPAAASSLGLPTPAAQTAGAAFEETITARDAYGNLATGYAGSKAIAFSGPASSPSGKAPSYPASVSFSAGAGSAAIALYDAQSTTLTATDGTLSGSTGSFTVSPAAVASVAVSVSGAQTEGGAFNVTLNAQDAYGNGLAGARAVSFSGPANAPDGTAPSYPASATFSGGSATASVTLYDAQSTTLSATIASVRGTSASFTVAAGAAQGLTYVGASNKNGSIAPLCTGPVTALSCKAEGKTEGKSRFFKASVALIDAHQNLATNAGASAVSVALAQTGGESISPASLSIAAGARTSSGQFEVKLANGSSTATVKASATVGGAAVTSNCAVN